MNSVHCFIALSAVALVGHAQVRFCSKTVECSENQCCLRVGRSNRAPAMCRRLRHEGETCNSQQRNGVYLRFCPCVQNQECHVLSKFFQNGRCRSSTALPATIVSNLDSSTVGHEPKELQDSDVESITVGRSEAIGTSSLGPRTKPTTSAAGSVMPTTRRSVSVDSETKFIPAGVEESTANFSVADQ